MASYKVPQDVEADDKLIGPFSFRQFIYLIIVAVAIGLAWALFQLAPPLVVIPLPVVLFFGTLALPLRKDQPMEIYMAAILSFYLKPRSRMWDPDGVETLVQIAAPRTIEPQRTKDVSTDEAVQRLRYLSDLSDTRGWSVRGVHTSPVGSSLNSDVFNEAQQTQDVLDENNSIAQNLNQMITQSDQRRHQEMLNRFQTAAITTPTPTLQQNFPVADPYATLSQTSPREAPTTPQFNPYPENMNQTVVQPLSQQPQISKNLPQENPSTEATSTSTISPDIMKLASNADLSIETIAREAHRISEKEASLDEEVVISLR